MKWTLLALATVLLLSFPQLLGLVAEPIVLALGAGVVADFRARRRRPVARDQRGPR
ncbi:hypothetical protein ACFZDI_29500 [Streptomyces sp. NPDC007907]|uniref:hypothetical protein n=1 Tax=Streptomyces sp. NPDC007907 TaxID=3364789 RepID=UPI0036E769CC